MLDWSPSQIGEYTVTVEVTDGSLSDSQSFGLAAYFIDCAGIVNGDSILDNCNVCDADASNDCVQDCSGAWGGG